jgi:hypothetical protein
LNHFFNFLEWFFWAEKESKEAFEKKYKPYLNFVRIPIFLLLIYCLFPLKNIVYISIGANFWELLSFGTIVYILIILYKAWIKAFWEFLKKDSIVHYIFLAVIPVAIVFLGYQYVFKHSEKKPPPDEGNKVQSVMTLKNDYDEIIDRLNGFYASLFTAIAVIAAILAVGAWRTIKELREKLESYKKIEEDVKFLKEKGELAKWIQKEFDKDDDKRILSSISFEDLNEDDQAKLKKIEKKIPDEVTDDSWLKLVYAKQLMENKKRVSGEDDFKKIKNILDYIGKRDLLKEDSKIKTRLHHLIGLMFWLWYKERKYTFIKEHKENKSKLKDWWKDERDEKDQKEDKKDGGDYSRIDLLEESIKSYKYTISLLEKKKKADDDEDETQGNLAVVYIELSKFKDREKNLDQAIIHLEKVKEKIFHTYWDHARVVYYIDPQKNKYKYKEFLEKATDAIETKKDKKFFIDTMKDEIEERGLFTKKGFPGDEELIKDLKKKNLDKRYLS